MKKVLIFLHIVIALTLFAATSVTAQEYRLDKAKVTLDIPESYMVATPDNIPNSVIQRTGYTRQQIVDYFAKSSTILLAYKDNHMIEVTSVASENSRKVVDSLNVSDELANKPEVLDSLKKKFKNERGFEVSNALSRVIGDARYYIIDGNAPAQGTKLYLRYYTTIKNSVNVGFTGQSLISNNSGMNADIEHIAKTAKFDKKSSSPGNSQPAQPISATKNKQSNFLGKTLGKAILIAIVAAVVQLWRHFKNKQQ